MVNYVTIDSWDRKIPTLKRYRNITNANGIRRMKFLELWFIWLYKDKETQWTVACIMLATSWWVTESELKEDTGSGDGRMCD